MSEYSSWSRQQWYLMIFFRIFRSWCGWWGDIFGVAVFKAIFGVILTAFECLGAGFLCGFTSFFLEHTCSSGPGLIFLTSQKLHWFYKNHLLIFTLKILITKLFRSPNDRLAIIFLPCIETICDKNLFYKSHMADIRPDLKKLIIIIVGLNLFFYKKALKRIFWEIF